MDDIIDDDKLTEIRSKTFSRIPVHCSNNREAVIGILLVKSLIGYHPKNPLPLREVYINRDCKIKPAYYCESNMKIGKILDYFKKGHTHMAIVCKSSQRMTEFATEVLKKVKSKAIVTDDDV